mmetsp:Transcript_112335/g.324493  ORF Transcript_112335/g.324493 Transcript_112335/m.324493 type:complete len:289 (-) Transcript_112335:501-1367(-)
MVDHRRHGRHLADGRLGGGLVAPHTVVVRGGRDDNRGRRVGLVQLLGIDLVAERLLGLGAEVLVLLVPGAYIGQVVRRSRVAFGGSQQRCGVGLPRLPLRSGARTVEHDHRRGRGEHVAERPRERGEGSAGAAEGRSEDHGVAGANLQGRGPGRQWCSREAGAARCAQDPPREEGRSASRPSHGRFGSALQHVGRERDGKDPDGPVLPGVHKAPWACHGAGPAAHVCGPGQARVLGQGPHRPPRDGERQHLHDLGPPRHRRRRHRPRRSRRQGPRPRRPPRPCPRQSR